MTACTLVCLVLVAAGEPALALSPGNVVASDHLTAACPTAPLAVKMNPPGLAGSAPALARMAEARCLAIAPDTRLVMLASIQDDGTMQVRPVSGVSEPLFVMASDFVLLSPPR